MAANVNAMQNKYVRLFPSELPMKAAQGFLATMAISLIMGSALNVALFMGAVAVTATLIEAITRPIVRTAFPDNPNIAAGTQIIIPRLLTISLGMQAASWLGTTFRMNGVLLPLLSWFALNEGFYKDNVAVAQVF